MPAAPRPRSVLRPGRRLRAARTLSWVLLALMVGQSAAGLGVPVLYPEQPWAVAAFRGNDLVTLVVAAPVLAVALLASRHRASSASVLVWLGMLHYGVYNYAYYAFGAAFDDAFLLHVAALVASMAGVLVLATSIDAEAAALGVAGGRRGRVVAAFTTFVGLALVAAWGGMSLRFAVTGALPVDVMPASAVHLVYAIDLSLLAPVFLVAGILLWRREAWGAVLAVAVNVSGAVYLTVLWVVGGFQADAGIAGTTWRSPVAVGSVLACLAATLALLVRPRGGRGRGAQATREPADATPSQSCGLPSQHQPSLGARAEIHMAGTRRSPRREPDSMKQRFFSSSSGAWVTTAMPSSMVSGVRPRPVITGRASSGRTPRNSSPRSTSRRR